MSKLYNHHYARLAAFLLLVIITMVGFKLNGDSQNRVLYNNSFRSCERQHDLRGRYNESISTAKVGRDVLKGLLLFYEERTKPISGGPQSSFKSSKDFQQTVKVYKKTIDKARNYSLIPNPPCSQVVRKP